MMLGEGWCRVCAGLSALYAPLTPTAHSVRIMYSITNLCSMFSPTNNVHAAEK